jgi:hypothetical protein
MCRLPIELMALIIGFTRKPLPPAKMDDVTWKDLCQPDLATLMRTSRASALISLQPAKADRVDAASAGRSSSLQGTSDW